MTTIPGWKMVPEVATDKMIDAGEASFRELTYPTPANAYRAYLAAAPTPRAVAADRDAVRLDFFVKHKVMWWQDTPERGRLCYMHDDDFDRREIFCVNCRDGIDQAIAALAAKGAK